MLYREIIAVCSQIHTKHIKTLCGQNVEFLSAKLAVHIVTTGLQKVKPILSFAAQKFCSPHAVSRATQFYKIALGFQGPAFSI